MRVRHALYQLSYAPLLVLTFQAATFIILKPPSAVKAKFKIREIFLIFHWEARSNNSSSSSRLMRAKRVGLEIL